MRFGAATLTLALTLALGLGAVGMASAQESGNWFTRMLAPAAEKADPDKLADKADAPKVAPVVNRNAVRAAKKAKADWERRVDVCDKLRLIALETEDDDLRRQVDRLEQRAWDIYLAAKNVASDLEMPPEPDAKKGARK